MSTYLLSFFMMLVLLISCSSTGEGSPDEESLTDEQVANDTQLPDNNADSDLPGATDDPSAENDPDDDSVADELNDSATDDAEMANDDDMVTDDTVTDKDDISADGLPSFDKIVGLGTEKDDFPVALTVAANGDVLVALYTQGALAGTNAGAIDAAVARYDSELNLKWVKQYGSTGYESPYDVDEASDGSIYITGTTSGPLNGITIKGYHDIFVMKLDADGNHLWTKGYGTEGREADAKLAIAADGAFYVSGTTDGALNGETNNGYMHAAIMKLDADGNVAWTQLFGTGSGDRGNHIAIGPEGDLYLAGQTYGAFPGNTHGGDTCAYKPCTDVYLARFQPDGTLVWVKQWGTSDNDAAWHVGVADDGTAYLTGNVIGEAFPGFSNAGTSDAIVIVVDADGGTRHIAQWGSSEEESISATVFWQGAPLVFGYSKGDLFGNTNLSAGSPDMFIGLLDEQGVPAELGYYGSDMWDQPTGIVASADALYLLGYTYGVVNGVTPEGYADMVLIKLH